MGLLDRLEADLSTPLGTAEIRVEGRVTRLIGLTLEAVGLRVALGEYCRVQIAPKQIADAEVVGFSGDRIYLMPLAAIEGLEPGAVSGLPKRLLESRSEIVYLGASSMA